MAASRRSGGAAGDFDLAGTGNFLRAQKSRGVRLGEAQRIAMPRVEPYKRPPSTTHSWLVHIRLSSAASQSTILATSAGTSLVFRHWVRIRFSSASGVSH